MAMRIEKQEPDTHKTMMALVGKFCEIEGEAAIDAKRIQCEALLKDLESLKVAQEAAKGPKKLSSLEKNKLKQKEKEELDLARKMAEFNQKKDKVPAPEVRHNKGKNFKTDIILPVNIIVGGNHLLEDTTLQLVQGTKYGLIGRNGIGKTCLIDAISAADIEGFPKNIHTLQVEQEVEGDEFSVLQHILACDVERTALLEEMEELTNEENDKKMSKKEKAAATARMSEVSDRLEFIESDEAEGKAMEILSGVGFSEEDFEKPSREFSGGWRMRIAIAKVLFCEPEILMLDEPTNHLDLPALIWLENYIMGLDTTIIIVSHARDFLDAICDKMIHFQGRKLTYWTGNFSQFVKSKGELDNIQEKARAGEQKKIAHMQTFVDRFKANAKLTTLAQSRMKAIAKMQTAMTEEVLQDPEVCFIFPNPLKKVPTPCMRLQEAKIGYPGHEAILEKVDFDVDLETRIALIGPNGAGKSTVVKALLGELEIFDGTRIFHNRLKVGIFTQHHADSYDLKKNALELMIEKWPDHKPVQDFRQHLGSFGLAGNLQLRPMYLMSGGQKSRVSFAMITWERPHILMLDEPTNHLDYDAINALIMGLNEYQGGLVVVSHDEYFLNALCDRLYLVDKGKCLPFKGDLQDYRKKVCDELGL